jgi:hypothetical protein
LRYALLALALGCTTEPVDSGDADTDTDTDADSDLGFDVAGRDRLADADFAFPRAGSASHDTSGDSLELGTLERDPRGLGLTLRGLDGYAAGNTYDDSTFGLDLTVYTTTSSGGVDQTVGYAAGAFTLILDELDLDLGRVRGSIADAAYQVDNASVTEDLTFAGSFELEW